MLTRAFPQLLAAGRLEAHTGSVKELAFLRRHAAWRGQGRGALNDATLTPFTAIIDGRSRLATTRSSPSRTCASSAS